MIGAGGVGLNAVQGAAVAGAAVSCWMWCRQARIARRFGATHGLSAGDEAVAQEVRSLTGRRGADYVFVAVVARRRSCGARACGPPGRSWSWACRRPASRSTVDSSRTRPVQPGLKLGAARIRRGRPRLVTATAGAAAARRAGHRALRAGAIDEAIVSSRTARRCATSSSSADPVRIAVSRLSGPDHRLRARDH